MPESVYGRIVSAPMIERGIEVTLRYWLGPYVGEALAQLGQDRGGLPDPDAIQRLARVDDFREGEQVAMVVIATPGTVGNAERTESGYAGMWEVQAGIVCDLGDPLATREAAQVYAAAIGTCLAHQGCAAVEPDGVTWSTDDHDRTQTLEGSHTWWAGEGYQPVPRRPDVYFGGATLMVRVDDARATWGGPDEPPAADARGRRVREAALDPVPSMVIPTLTINGATSPRGDVPVPGVFVQVEPRDPIGSDPPGYFVNADTGEFFVWKGGQ
jgi:hypothetical protein